ncbi:hypothetical protein [Thermoflexibacter ruber]|uniref:Uncharacterized protein n=1 Tax=Thermoflexibacter ruber TaxID=1003 RepID=A0A1I2J515_9BACT|nr:hypothetical protein [Thermoflexibacter ruber]SFF48327.1 hypothetical protein SAMN04488541_104024 [Thermoflexibacter ruber]
MDIKENLKLISKAGLAIIRTLIVVVSLGIFVNWTLAVIGFFIIKPLSSGAVVVLLLGFMVGLPIAYFQVGKNYAIRRGLYLIFKEKKVALFEYIVYQILNSAKDKVLTSQNFKDYLSKTSLWLKHFPKPIQFIISFLLSKVPVHETLLSVIKNQEISEKTIGDISEKVAKELDERTPVNFIQPNLAALWFLMLINLIGFIIVFMTK